MFRTLLSSYIIKFYILLLLFFPAATIMAQDFTPDYITYHSEYVPVTPNAATFKVYGDTPVNHATGVPQIEIPLFTIEEDGFSLPISISYHASGIKVDQLAGVAGLGWTLNAGGGIFRQVNDKADEVGWLVPSAVGYIDAQWVVNNPLNDFDSQTEMAFSNNNDDYIPDDFSYTLNGMSGAFILNHDGTVEEETRSTLKITRIPGTGQLSSYTVADGSGNTYHLGTRETNRTNVVSGTGAGLSFDSSTHTSGWMVDRVVTRNNRQIDFTYQDYNLQYTFNNVSHSITRAPQCPESVSVCGCQGSGGGFTTSQSTTTITNYPFNKLVSQIESPTVRVTFTYADDATLATWKRKLTRVTILDKIGNRTKYFDFTYGKFTGDPRLRLDQVQETGFDGTVRPPYTFTYNGISLPDKSSTSKDFLGYYNGAINSTLIPFSLTAFNTLSSSFRSRLANRKENLLFLRAGTLTKIQYPTKGSTHFEYEANAVIDTTPVNPVYTTKNIKVSNQIYTYTGPDANRTYFRVPFTISENEDQVFGTPVTYRADSNICNFDPGFPSIDCSRFNIYERSGSFVLQPGVFNPYKVIGAEGSVNLMKGDYMLELSVANADLTANPGANIEVFLSWREEAPGPQQTFYTGGLRAKTITNRDADDQILTQRSYTYDGLTGYQPSVANTIKSYGESTVYSADNLALNPTLIKNGYYYKNVTINQVGAAGDTIRTVEKFEDAFRNKSYAPQMVQQDMYRGTHKVRSVYMQYDNTVDKDLQFWVLGDKDFCYTNQLNGVIFLVFNNPNPRNYRHRKNLLSQRTRIDYLYEQGDPFTSVVEIDRYQYNNQLQLSRQEKDNRYYAQSLADAEQSNFTLYADGDWYQVDYTYPVDHTTQSSTLNQLNNKHMTALPVSRKIYNHSRLILGQFQDYDTNGNATATYRYHKGQGSNTAGGHIPADYELFSSFRMDTRGRPAEIVPYDGTPVALLWDTSGTYLLAQLEDVTKNQLDTEVPLGVNLFTTGETQLQTIYSGLRTAFPGAMITTYSYTPLTGLARSNDTRNMTTYYDYDGLNRLIRVRDLNNRMLQEMIYHYQQP